MNTFIHVNKDRYTGLHLSPFCIRVKPRTVLTRWREALHGITQLYVANETEATQTRTWLQYLGKPHLSVTLSPTYTPIANFVTYQETTYKPLFETFVYQSQIDQDRY